MIWNGKFSQKHANDTAAMQARRKYLPNAAKTYLFLALIIALPVPRAFGACRTDIIMSGQNFSPDIYSGNVINCIKAQNYTAAERSFYRYFTILQGMLDISTADVKMSPQMTVMQWDYLHKLANLPEVDPQKLSMDEYSMERNNSLREYSPLPEEIKPGLASKSEQEFDAALTKHIALMASETYYPGAIYEMGQFLARNINNDFQATFFQYLIIAGANLPLVTDNVRRNMACELSLSAAAHYKKTGNIPMARLLYLNIVKEYSYESIYAKGTKYPYIHEALKNLLPIENIPPVAEKKAATYGDALNMLKTIFSDRNYSDVPALMAKNEITKFSYSNLYNGDLNPGETAILIKYGYFLAFLDTAGRILLNEAGKTKFENGRLYKISPYGTIAIIFEDRDGRIVLKELSVISFPARQ